LGHTLKHCEHEFKFLSEFNDFDDERFTFEELKHALSTVDVDKVSADYGRRRRLR